MGNNSAFCNFRCRDFFAVLNKDDEMRFVEKAIGTYRHQMRRVNSQQSTHLCIMQFGKEMCFFSVISGRVSFDPNRTKNHHICKYLCVRSRLLLLFQSVEVARFMCIYNENTCGRWFVFFRLIFSAYRIM